jgi:hypothetical protein
MSQMDPVGARDKGTGCLLKIDRSNHTELRHDRRLATVSTGSCRWTIFAHRDRVVVKIQMLGEFEVVARRMEARQSSVKTKKSLPKREKLRDNWPV